MLSVQLLNVGILLDSSPDRWGRVLMIRNEAAKARKEERRPNTLMESDYLLGVYGHNRMGGLRFKTAYDAAVGWLFWDCHTRHLPG